MQSVKIFKNTAILGGGLKTHSDRPIYFDSINRCSIFLNDAFKGHDIYGLNNSETAYLDTFTVLQPTQYFCYASYPLNFDILHAKKEKITGNLYVDDNGSNENSGLIPSEPLKSIALALELIEPDSLNVSTIFVSQGYYEFFTTFETYPLIMKSHTIIQGESSNNVILKSGLKGLLYNWETGAIELESINNCSIKTYC